MGGTLYVFYDGWCPACRRLARIGRHLDFFGRLEPVSFRRPGFFESGPGAGVRPRRAEERLICADEYTGRRFEGVDAVAEIIKRLPLLWPFLIPVGAARLLGFGGPLYDFIARRRTVIPGGMCTPSGCPPAGGAEPEPGTKGDGDVDGLV